MNKQTYRELAEECRQLLDEPQGMCSLALKVAHHSKWKFPVSPWIPAILGILIMCVGIIEYFPMKSTAIGVICLLLGGILGGYGFEEISPSKQGRVTERYRQILHKPDMQRFLEHRARYQAARQDGYLSDKEEEIHRRVLTLIYVTAHWREGLMEDPRPYMRALREQMDPSLRLLQEVPMAEQELEAALAELPIPEEEEEEEEEEESAEQHLASNT